MSKSENNKITGYDIMKATKQSWMHYAVWNETQRLMDTALFFDANISINNTLRWEISDFLLSKQD